MAKVDSDQELDNLLITGMGKQVGLKIAKSIEEGHFKSEQLFERIANKQDPQNKKAAWVLSTLSDSNPTALSNNISKVVELIRLEDFGGIRRDLLRIILNSDIAQKDHGPAMDIAFEHLNKNGVDVAEKFNSLKILMKLRKLYPEISTEIKESLNYQKDLSTKTFGNLCRKAIQRIEKDGRW